LDRAEQPLRYHIAEAKAVVRLNLLTAAASSKELIAQRARSRDPAIDGPPSLLSPNRL
jgi:hypothetical protein